MLTEHVREALTYDDILLVPGYSEVLPAQVRTETRVTRGLTLNIPLVSSAMDSVTEAEMGIAMACQGGLGVIHKNLDPEAQAAQVLAVKRFKSRMVDDPLTVNPEQTLEDAVRIMRNARISGLPVTVGRQLVGIVTNRDLRFQQDLGRRVAEVMTTEVVTAPEGTTLDEAKKLLHSDALKDEKNAPGA